MTTLLGVLTAGVAGAWALLTSQMVLRRRAAREERTIAAHHRALRSLDAMRARPISGLNLGRDDEDHEHAGDPPELPKVRLLDGDRALPQLPMETMGGGPAPRPVPCRPPALPEARDPVRRPWVVVVAATAAVALLAVGALALGSGSGSRDTGSTPEQRAAPALRAAPPPTRVAPPTTVVPTTTEPHVVSLGPAAVRIAVAAGSRLVFHAAGRCWLRASTDAGVVLYEGILSAGTSTSFRAVGPLAIRLGAAGEVALVISGRTLPLPAVGDNPIDIAVVPQVAA